jgi:hypothetical protein
MFLQRRDRSRFVEGRTVRRYDHVLQEKLLAR